MRTKLLTSFFYGKFMDLPILHRFRRIALIRYGYGPLFNSIMYADIILDYPFGYKQKQIAGFINFSLFIDTPLDISLARRMIRDFENESTESIINDMKGYLERGQSVCIQTQKISEEDSDLVIDGSLPINQIVYIIMKRIKKL